MSKEQKTTFLLLISLFLVYFLAFIPANNTGAKDPVMISIFEPDEFAQYSIPRDMLTKQDSFKHSVYNFIAYDHYYYGYPFYISSILATLPVSLTQGFTNKNTQMVMLLLRQWISVLPMLISIGLVMFMSTRFRSRIASLILAGFLLSIPAVVENNLWWHPDSLVVMFIVATLACLVEDRFRLRRFFWLAAVSCGLAVGTKVLGFFFFLTIPLYLFLGYREKAFLFRRLLFSAVVFVAIMVATIILSNPYLLIPSEFNQMIQIMTRQSSAMSNGWTLNYEKGVLSWLPILTHLYGSLPFLLVVLGLLAGMVASQRSRLMGLLILSWVMPLSIYILFFTAIKPTHFFLPIVIPLFAVLVLPFLELNLGFQSKDSVQSLPERKKWLLFAVCLVILIQFGQNLFTDVQIYRAKLTREESNPAIQMYSQFNDKFGDRLSDVKQVSVLRDVRTYFPASSRFKVSEFYNTLNADQLQKKHPDLLILWKQRIRDYASAKSIANAVDPESYQEIQKFFNNAANNQISGYRLLDENENTKIFISEAFDLQYHLTSE